MNTLKVICIGALLLGGLPGESFANDSAHLTIDPPPLQIERYLPNSDEKYREYLLEDAIFILLHPFIKQAVEKELGMDKQYWCPKLVEIKKREKGSYYFEITVQVETFTGPHNPPNHDVTLTVNNYSLDWKLVKTYSRLQQPGERSKCRHPVHLPIP